MIFGRRHFLMNNGMADLLGGGGPTPKADDKQIDPIEPNDLDNKSDDDKIVSPTGESDSLEDQLKRLAIEKELVVTELESKLKEAREDAAKKRLQNKSLKDQASDLFLKEREDLKKEMKELKEQADKYKSIQKDKENSEKSAEERLALLELEMLERDKSASKSKKKADEAQSQLQEYLDKQKEEDEIRSKILEEKIQEELLLISEDKRKFAELIVRGESDKQAGLHALLEAKHSNMFGVKRVEVAHNVPKGNNENITDQNKTSKVKIKDGLKSINSGGLKPGDRLV